MRFHSYLVLGSVLFCSAVGNAFEVQVAEAPTSDLGLTVSAIQSAKSTLLLNIYDLSSPQITEALLERIQAGVLVQIIEEGQPVGGLPAAARGIQSQLAQAMRKSSAKDRLLEMTSKAQAGTKRRFRYDHAKYAVIDGKSLLIGSENYSPTGNPQPGAIGNRGWEVLIHDAAISKEYEAIFKSDADTSKGDLLDLTQTAAPARKLSETETPPTSDAASTPPTTLEADSVYKITSPDRMGTGLVALIGSAKARLDIEQMTFDPAWKGADQSPLLTAVIAAARRGVKVRVLVNDEQVFSHPSNPAKPKNTVTVSTLNQLAQTEHLNIEARVANLKAMGVDYIHNKGVLVDDTQTLISSINWDENATENNREAAVVLSSATINAHYSSLFDSDWKNSASAGVTATSGSNPDPVISNPKTPVIDCPNALSLVAEIHELTVNDQEDADFAQLSGKRIAAKFTRAENGDRCLLIEDGPNGTAVSARRYVEIRMSSDLSRTILLEGYTPKTNKLYSIRTHVPAANSLSGSFSAQVYDGSGPSRERLGTAKLVISIDSNASGAQ